VIAQGALLSPAVMAGESVVVRYTVRNQALWPLAWVLLEPHGFALLPVEPQFIPLGPRCTREIDVQLVCPRRGYWPAGGWTLRAGDPFGLFERSTTRAGSTCLVVYPRPLPVPGLNLSEERGSRFARRGTATAFASAVVGEVRPYRPGDPPSRIHWLSSARLNRLVVKEPEGEPAAHAWLILDLREQVQYADDPAASVEGVVGAACTVLHQLFRRRLATGLLTVGTSDVSYPDDRPDAYERLLGTLARAQPGTQDVERALQRVSRRTGYRLGGDRGTIVLIAPGITEQWAALLTQWARLGGAVVFLLIDMLHANQDDRLAAHATRLRAAGVRVHRCTSRAA
jgi:uncharacterized protein (DUF58 family)